MQGHGLPYRPPPTVDEAIPYSPFTSIIPFSLDIIPFPSAEPPTPPSTLTPEQQQAARRAVGILNSEIHGQSTATHLSNTIGQLCGLLDPEELPEYNFKSIPQLATPPSESPTKQVNGTSSRVTSSLSPFAAMLLKSTNIAYSSFGNSANEPTRSVKPSQQITPLPRATSQTHTPNNAAYAQNGAIPYPSRALSSVPSSTPLRPGPAVVIKPEAVNREEYQRFDNIAVGALSSQRKAGSGTSVLRPHEREIADRKIEELEAFVVNLNEERDDLDATGSFTRVSTSDGEMNVIEQRAMDRLSDKMANVNNLGHFAELSVDLVSQVQKLLEPSITCTGQIILFPQDEDWSEGIGKARAALQASKLMLTSMIDGRDDYRLRPEDTVSAIIDLIKVIRNECIVPIIQARRGDSLFDSATSRRKELLNVLRGCGAVLSRFATLIGKVNLPERGLNILEDLTVGLLVEQNSDSEKDSVFGIKVFETFRQKAMDVLAQIFARHTDQRPSILNGILSNLEKLPDKKASARQFRSAREVPVMSISALFMRFVQVAAMNKETRISRLSGDPEDRLEEGNSDYELGASVPQTSKPTSQAGALSQIAKFLAANARNIADTITGSLIHRASNVSKTGDKPFRNLLDLFIEDFLNVLGSPEWPAATILLQSFLARMVITVSPENATKRTVVDKDMALSTLAKMGCGIIDFKHRLRQLKRGLDTSQSELSAKLDHLAENAFDDKNAINAIDLYEFQGPIRMVIESLSSYLELRRDQEDLHLQSVTGCHVTLWLDAVLEKLEKSEKSSDPPSPQLIEVQRYLEAMLADPRWLERKYKFQEVSENQAKLAAGIVTSQAPLCTYVPNIVMIMRTATEDKVSSKLRSRGMTGLEQLIEKDPRVVDEHMVNSLVGSLRDASPMVREHTLGLVAQCLERDPSREKAFLGHVLTLTTDPSNGPKKKAIKLLKGLYISTPSKENRLSIAKALLLPSQDDEKAIAELSRGVLEELWMTPLASATRSDEHQVRLDRAHRAVLLADVIQAIHRQPILLECFEKFLIFALSDETKAKTLNTRLCKELIAEMFDKAIEIDSTTGTKSPQAKILHALSVFAKIDPTLFTMAQVDDLKIHLIAPKQTTELAIIQPIVRIFRYVFPTLPFLDPKLAEHARANLMGMLTKLAQWAALAHVTSRDTLTDVAHCLWTICPLVELGLVKLFTSIHSSLCIIQSQYMGASKKEKVVEKQTSACALIILIGALGSVCVFDEHTKMFMERLANYARTMVSQKKARAEDLAPLIQGSSSVSLLLLDTVRPFTMQIYTMDVREHAMRSVGGICQQAPELFMRKEIEKLIKLVFVNQDTDRLKLVVLSTFEVYFTRAERRSETGSAIAVGEGAVHGSARLESSYSATATDAATTHVAKQFLGSFKGIALTNNNKLAETATNIIASISRAGLEHPKECGAALVALSTSKNKNIAQVAAVEHKRIHEKQESYLEKEYVQAVRIAFDYQRDVFQDPHGMLETNYSPKLAHLFDALKGGKKATFKKFVDNLSKQLNFDFAKLDTTGEMPDVVLYTRFCLENLGLADLTTLDMVASFIDRIEAIVLKDTGPLVAGEIDKEMPQKTIRPQHSFVSANLNDQLQAMAVDQSMGQSVENFNPPPSLPAPLDISDDRLRKFAIACMILHMIWETRTFIRRCYNVHKYGTRIPQKEYAKPAQRNNFIPGKDLWDRLAPYMSALDSREAMIKCCYDFSELLNVDREVKVGEDEDGLDAALMDAGYETPTETGDDARRSASIPTSGRGRKRKTNVSLSNTPKKPRNRPSGSKSKSRGSKPPDDDEDSE
ncbi:Sister chromatid cohesion protein 2 [Didymella sp. IMI 355093]|nr:Sister chromatid cohesion protein 2 [Didymella sp. IMI 355093]